MAHGDQINPRMLLVIDLDLSVTADDLYNHLKDAGEVIWTQIIKEKSTTRSRGEGYVSFAQPECADKAISKLDRSLLKGKVIHVAKSGFSFNQVVVEISDEIEDRKLDDEFAKMFSQFGPLIRTKQFAQQVGERYLVLTFVDHQGAARAATALEKRKFLVYDMALAFIALVDPHKEEEKEHQAAKKFLAWTEMVSSLIQPKCAIPQASML